MNEKNNITGMVKVNLVGEDVDVQAFAGKMRYLATATFWAVPENAESMLAGKRMRLTRHPDGSATVEMSCLVSLDTATEELETLGDVMLTEMETAMGMPEGEFVSSTSWNAGHIDTDWDDLMTAEEQAIVKTK